MLSHGFHCETFRFTGHTLSGRTAVFDLELVGNAHIETSLAGERTNVRVLHEMGKVTLFLPMDGEVTIGDKKVKIGELLQAAPAKRNGQ